jgi:hypothetical protein
MAPWNNRTSQSSGVIGKAIRDQLGEEEILLRDVLITRDRALALTDQRLLDLSLRANFLRRSIRIESYPLRAITGIEIDDLCPHYTNGTRPTGFNLKLIGAGGTLLAECFGENDAIDTMIQLLLELQQHVYLLSDRHMLEIPAAQYASDLPDELGRRVNFMLQDGEGILFELNGKNERSLCLTEQRLILVRNSRVATPGWGEYSVIEIPYGRLDRILTSAEIVNPQIVMHMAIYFERFGEPLPGGKAEHVSVLGLHWTQILQAAMIANTLKYSRRSSYVSELSGLS